MYIKRIRMRKICIKNKSSDFLVFGTSNYFNMFVIFFLLMLLLYIPKIF